jgi:DNA helicase-2/ATP-dependent DNA helicase PcrA
VTALPEFVLTEEQRAVLAHDRRLSARVLAGPGTGKSATLVALIGEMVKEKPPPRVRLLTFTRAATAELANKLEDHPAAIVERPSTIHSFAISVLLRNGKVGDLPRPLRIADDWERHEIVRPTLARRAGVGVKRLDLLLRELAANWESLIEHEEPEIGSAERSRFMGAWQEHRAVYGYTLLSELPYALRGALRDYPDLKGVNYDVLLVDEYQDLNACDLEVLRRISQRGCSIISAGDDEQSIFSFRKAAPEGILRFFEDYPNGIAYPLSITQRCGRRIVEWANSVILGNPDRNPGRAILTCAGGAPPGEAALLSFTSDEGEAKVSPHSSSS